MRQKSGFLTLILSLLIALSTPHKALAEEAKEPDYRELAKSLCALYDASRTLVDSSKLSIMKFISKHENVANPTIEDMIYHLNLHKHEMICYNINYLSYAFERGAYNQIILDLFANQLYSDDILLDFNSITMTKNPETNREEPMTVLDYIDKVALKTSSIAGDNTTKREIKEIRRMLIEDFGAKPFSELGDQALGAMPPSQLGELIGLYSLPEKATQWKQLAQRNDTVSELVSLQETLDIASAAKGEWILRDQQNHHGFDTPIEVSQANSLEEKARQALIAGDIQQSKKYWNATREAWQSASHSRETAELNQKRAMEQRFETDMTWRAQLLDQANPVMVKIPAGSYWMGCTIETPEMKCHETEKPKHKVSIPSFYLQEHEVTFAQWDACIAAGACDSRVDDDGEGRGNRPVYPVKYLAVVNEFIPWLNKVTGKQYRLPSEAEWEYAARAASETLFSWGNEISCANANYSGCGNGPKRVKNYAPNAWGLFDMYGNVYEFTADCYDPHSYKSSTHGANGQAWTSKECNDRPFYRAVRGGGFGNYIEPKNLRSSERSLQEIYIGFRLAHDF